MAVGCSDAKMSIYWPCTFVCAKRVMHTVSYARHEHIRVYQMYISATPMSRQNDKHLEHYTNKTYMYAVRYATSLKNDRRTGIKCSSQTKRELFSPKFSQINRWLSIQYFHPILLSFWMKHYSDVIMRQWRHNEGDGVSNHRRLDCLLNRLFGQIKENTKAPRHWPLWGESTGDHRFPSQRVQ